MNKQTNRLNEIISKFGMGGSMNGVRVSSELIHLSDRMDLMEIGYERCAIEVRNMQRKLEGLLMSDTSEGILVIAPVGFGAKYFHIKNIPDYDGAPKLMMWNEEGEGMGFNHDQLYSFLNKYWKEEF